MKVMEWYKCFILGGHWLLEEFLEEQQKKLKSIGIQDTRVLVNEVLDENEARNLILDIKWNFESSCV